MRFSRRALSITFGLLVVALVVGGALAAFEDWGLDVQTQLQNKSHPLFGVGNPLTKSSTVDFSPA